jgi:predicted lipoprotein with Yx(FWY)xxD motif
MPARLAGPLGATLAVALVAGGCSGSSGSAGSSGDALLGRAAAEHVVVGTRAVAGLGRVPVDGAGHVLYLFSPDARRHVTCVGGCAGTWPPLAIRNRGGHRRRGRTEGAAGHAARSEHRGPGS